MSKRVTTRLINALILASVGVVTSVVQASPNNLSFQGRIVKPDGQPLESTTASATVTVRSDDGRECVLLEESYNLNMQGSNGVFRLSIGGGAATTRDPNRAMTSAQRVGLLPSVIANDSASTLAATNCIGGTQSFTPALNSTRRLFVAINDGSGNEVFFSDPYVLNSVPYAIDSQRLAGKLPSFYLQTANPDVTQPRLNTIMSRYDDLVALLNAGPASYSAIASNITMTSASPRVINVARPATAGTVGSSLTVAAGGAASNSVDASGGNLVLASGTATGTASSAIQFQTSSPQSSSSNGDNVPSTKMTILGNGNVGIGVTAPVSKLDVDGAISSTKAFALSGTTVLSQPQATSLAIGAGAMPQATGEDNVAVGSNALHDATTATGNVAVGSGAHEVGVGNYNVAVGSGSLQRASASYNIGVGHGALAGEGNQNKSIGIGYWAVRNLTSGAGNVAIGHNVGSTLTTGSNNVLIGNGANVPAATTSGFVNIGNGIFGSGFNGTTAAPAGVVGIGTTDPQQALHVYKNANADAMILMQNAYAGKAAYLQTNANSLFSSVDLLGRSGSVFTNWKFGLFGDTSFKIVDGTNGSAITYPLIVEKTAPTNALYVRSNGNVGIGTATAGSKLEVAGTVTATRMVASSAPVVAWLPTAVAANYAIASTDTYKFFLANGNITLTLPAPATVATGFTVGFNNTGTGTVVLNPNAAEKINGSTTHSLSPGSSVSMITDGTNWFFFNQSVKSTAVTEAANATAIVRSTNDSVCVAPACDSGFQSIGCRTGTNGQSSDSLNAQSSARSSLFLAVANGPLSSTCTTTMTGSAYNWSACLRVCVKN